MMRNLQVYSEPELTEPVDLCRLDGRLNREAVGWSRRPLHNCNLSGNPLRKKRWNYWCVVTDSFLFSVTLSNIDYMGLAFVYLLDFKSRFFHEKTIIRPFGRGCDLGNLVEDNAVFCDPKLMISMINDPGTTVIKVTCPDFNYRQLEAELKIKTSPNHQSLNVVIPWSDSRFQFTSKQHSLPAEGSITLGEVEYKADGGYACLDFGRGVWPFSSFWNWAGGSGNSDNQLIALNLGAGWTDGTGMNENGIFIDGILYKISEDLVFEYNLDNFMLPWTIRTHASDLVNLTFSPFFERVAKTNALVLRSEVHQMIGRFSGTIKDTRGNIYPVTDLIGWAEEHYARW